MKKFARNSFLWLLAGSLIVSCSALAWRVMLTSAAQAHDVLRQVERSQADLEELKVRLTLWQKVHSMDRIVPVGVLHTEAVAISADLPPQEFPGIGNVLAKMYTENGSFNLKSLLIDFSHDSHAHLSIMGDKTFKQ
jgi:hypothetical protein